MKKVALLAVVLSLITMNAKAQWFDFSENSEDLTIGVNIGAVGYHFNVTFDFNNDLLFGCHRIDDKVIITVRTVFICFRIKISHIFAEALMAFLANECQFCCAFQWMIRALFCMTLSQSTSK